MLREFLRADPAWRFEGDLEANTSLFRKLREGSSRRPWSQQPFVVERGRSLRRKYKARYLMGLVARRDWAALAGVFRRVLRRGK